MVDHDRQSTPKKTQNNISFVSPYWCPFTMIAWLCTKAIAIPESGGGANASAGYCFFQNKYGYYFMSYDKFAFMDTTHQLIVGYDPEELEKLGNKVPIDSMRVVSSSDVLQGLNYGSYNSTVLTIDMKDMEYGDDEMLLSPTGPKSKRLAEDFTDRAIHRGTAKSRAYRATGRQAPAGGSGWSGILRSHATQMPSDGQPYPLSTPRATA